ncbi:hypothetical protein ACFLSE_07395 [Bacteroidota bacterium]
MEELVFAIPTVELWNILPYKEKGLIYGNSDILNRIVQNGLFRKRKELEEDPAFKQIIPYAVISNKDSYYLFKRLSGQAEKRLHNKFTLGVGGHMNPTNSIELNEQYPLDELKREFFEELKLLDGCLIEKIDFIGFINDDTISVGKHHIGFLYRIQLSNKNLVINESDKMSANWIDKKEFPKFYNDLESWSKMAFDYFTTS